MPAVWAWSRSSRAVAAAVSLTLLGALCPRALDPSRSLLQYSLQKWDAAQGLPQNSIQAMLQTRDGYLWLGTQEGLVRFDGVRFTVFDATNTPAMVRNDVRAILEARDGALWIGTYGGGLLRVMENEILSFGAKQNLSGDAVLSLAEEPPGVIGLAPRLASAASPGGRSRRTG